MQEHVRVCRYLHTHGCVYTPVCVCVFNCTVCIMGALQNISLLTCMFPSSGLHWNLHSSCSPSDDFYRPPARFMQLFSIYHRTAISHGKNHLSVLLWSDLNPGVTWSIFVAQGFSTCKFKMLQIYKIESVLLLLKLLAVHLVKTVWLNEFRVLFDLYTLI